MSENNPKSKVIAYWATTTLFCLVLAGGGVGGVLRIEPLREIMTGLGYPLYLLTMLGVAKLLIVAAVLAPGFPHLKEWAYAGIAFGLGGAVISHATVRDPIPVTLAPLAVLAVVLMSYFLRPESRRLPS